MKFSDYKDARSFLDTHPNMNIDDAIAFLNQEIKQVEENRIESGNNRTISR